MDATKKRLQRSCGASPKSPMSRLVPHPGTTRARGAVGTRLLAERQATPADAKRLRAACAAAHDTSYACAANDKRDAHSQAQARSGQSVLPLADFLWFSESITASNVIATR